MFRFLLRHSLHLTVGTAVISVALFVTLIAGARLQPGQPYGYFTTKGEFFQLNFETGVTRKIPLPFPVRKFSVSDAGILSFSAVNQGMATIFVYDTNSHLFQKFASDSPLFWPVWEPGGSQTLAAANIRKVDGRYSVYDLFVVSHNERKLVSEGVKVDWIDWSAGERPSLVKSDSITGVHQGVKFNWDSPSKILRLFTAQGDVLFYQQSVEWFQAPNSN